MRLHEYFEREGVGSKSRVARESGVAYTTVLKAEAEGLSRKDAAEKISAATKGEVSVAEILRIDAHAPADQPVPTGEPGPVAA
jgi:hypothetical protein